MEFLKLQNLRKVILCMQKMPLHLESFHLYWFIGGRAYGIDVKTCVIGFSEQLSSE